MEPTAIRTVARRYFAQGEANEAEFALLAAIGKERDAGQENGETWADLGVTLYEVGKKKQSLAALLHAIDAGVTRTEIVASALQVARELDLVAHAKATITRHVPAQILARIEQALDALPPVTTPATPAGR